MLKICIWSGSNVNWPCSLAPCDISIFCLPSIIFFQTDDICRSKCFGWLKPAYSSFLRPRANPYDSSRWSDVHRKRSSSSSPTGGFEREEDPLEETRGAADDLVGRRDAVDELVEKRGFFIPRSWQENTGGSGRRLWQLIASEDPRYFNEYRRKWKIWRIIRNRNWKSI